MEHTFLRHTESSCGATFAAASQGMEEINAAKVVTVKRSFVTPEVNMRSLFMKRYTRMSDASTLRCREMHLLFLGVLVFTESASSHKRVKDNHWFLTDRPGDHSQCPGKGEKPEQQFVYTRDQ